MTTSSDIGRFSKSPADVDGRSTSGNLNSESSSAEDARLAEVSGWHTDPLLEIIRGLPADLASRMALIAAVKLVAHMSSEHSEEFLKVLAKRVIETRSRNDSSLT
jgi:hypothetical protein